MIIPALDLIQGEVVRLEQGDYGKQTTFHYSPVEKFREYCNDGANYLHLVDLDGAKNPQERQIATIRKIIKAIDIPIQVGGGIRTKEDVEALLKIGVARVVIGSTAVREPEEVKKWFEEYGGDRLVLALDIRLDKGKKKIAISGWQETSEQTLEEMIALYQPVGLSHVLCTDISRDGMLTGSNVELYQELTTQYPKINFQSSGGIGTLADIQALKPSKVYGVIVGRALLENRFTLKEAIACWRA